MSAVYLDTESSQGNCTYLPRDAATGCLEPRPCRECLQKEGCMIGTLGFCESETISQTELEYSHAIALDVAVGNNTSTGPLESQHWQFPAYSASYCPTSDTMCKKCIASRFGLPTQASTNSSSDSRFCVGANGCVCVANCEISAIDWPACPSSSSSSSFSGDAAATIAVAPPTGPATVSSYDESCRYYPPDPTTGCKRTRPCDDCLRTPGCRIGAYDFGFCEADTSSDSLATDANHFHHAFTQNATLPKTPYTNLSALWTRQLWFFPAFQAKYCPMTDANCRDCMARNYELSSMMPVDNRFCVGEDGCICVASCARSEIVESCPWFASEPNKGGSSGSGDTTIYIALVVLVLIIIAVVAFSWGCFCCLRWQHRHHREGVAAANHQAQLPQQVTEVPMAVPVAQQVIEADEWNFHAYHRSNHVIRNESTRESDDDGDVAYVQLRRL